VPFEKGGSYICLLSEYNGPNLLDELLNGFIWYLVFLELITPMQLKIMNHNESVHLYTELKTGILAVPTDTGGLRTSTDR
jgi:hypothetical protein